MHFTGCCVTLNPRTGPSDFLGGARARVSSEITLETVKKHNHRDDIWLVISGHAYDVTKFLEEVP